MQYKYVIPATPENIEVRLACIGLDPARRMFDLASSERISLKLFLRYNFMLVVRDGKVSVQPGKRKHLKLSI